MVADVVRHLNAVGLAAVSADFGILTNSATQKLNLDKALALGCQTFGIEMTFRYVVFVPYSNVIHL
jgi:hypothetical protein